jgi:predicted SAM-dependent methyltransferase
MKKGAVLRIAVPDADKLIKYYQANQLNIFDEINDGCARNEFESGKLWSLLFEGHKIAYDFNGLKTLGEKAGFVVENKTFCNGNEQIVKETIDMLPEISLFVEMTKN